MARVGMEASGRFGQLFATAIQQKGISLAELAAQVDRTYEQMRKLYIGTSSPPASMLKVLSKALSPHLDQKAALEASNSDRMERRFGKTAFSMAGKNPRFSDIEDLLPQLSDLEWTMFVNQMRGYVHQKRRSK